MSIYVSYDEVDECSKSPNLHTKFIYYIGHLGIERCSSYNDDHTILECFVDKPVKISEVVVPKIPLLEDAFVKWYDDLTNVLIPKMGNLYVEMFSLLLNDSNLFFWACKRIEHKGLDLKETIVKIKMIKYKLKHG